MTRERTYHCFRCLDTGFARIVHPREYCDRPEGRPLATAVVACNCDRGRRKSEKENHPLPAFRDTQFCWLPNEAVTQEQFRAALDDWLGTTTIAERHGGRSFTGDF